VGAGQRPTPEGSDGPPRRATCRDARIGRSMAQFDEFLAYNELELAWNALAEAVEDDRPRRVLALPRAGAAAMELERHRARALRWWLDSRVRGVPMIQYVKATRPPVRDGTEDHRPRVQRRWWVGARLRRAIFAALARAGATLPRLVPR